jgi:hypothetical protein
MYYSKYIKYKNKYLCLKYQIGGQPKKSTSKSKPPPLEQQFLQNIEIPPASENLHDINRSFKENQDKSLKKNLVWLKVKEQNLKLLVELGKFNKKIKKDTIYFYRYTDSSIDSTKYILCSFYEYWDILNKLQKKNVRIEKININEEGSVSLKLRNITIPYESKEVNLENVKKKLIEDLVGIKIFETKSNIELLKPLIRDKDFNDKNNIYFYRYTDTNGNVYILCSLYSYYEFLYILYEHIEIEEINGDKKINIDEDGNITIVPTDKIYHIIPKPYNVLRQAIHLPIVNSEISDLVQLINALRYNSFIIIKNESIFLSMICMYNLFIGTIHVFVIFDKKLKTEYFLLSLFTKYELMLKIDIDVNIELHECRLYEQDKKINIILNKYFVRMMFKIYQSLKHTGHYANRLKRGDPTIDDLILDELDPKLLENSQDCVSVKKVAFNTNLYLRPEFFHIKDHKNIQEMIEEFNKNKFYKINNNNKLYLWKYNYENLIQLWEYNLVELEKEVLKFKKELLELEPCHKELLVLKLNEKGYCGITIEQILDESALCYFSIEDQNKNLVYENTEQKDKTPADKMPDFVNSCKYFPEKEQKIKQTVLLGFSDKNKYRDNQSYFFAMSWHMSTDRDFDKAFDPIAWSFKLNKLFIQCVVLKDLLIFPFRIVNFVDVKSPLSVTLNVDDCKINPQVFCGYLLTSFTDGYNSEKPFEDICRDKLYLIYGYKDENYIDSAGKTYKPYYYTGNSIKFDVSILPYYRTFVCEINWLYYTFILKFNKIPYFYQYTTHLKKKEIVVSQFSLDEIKKKYTDNKYNADELADLKQVYFNYEFYLKNTPIFVDEPLLITEKEITDFIDKVKHKSKLHYGK